ncbi:MAG: DEAD/DEAH box helicase [Gemmatimonadales bacterium]
MRFVPWWTAPPAIVAESLVEVPDPMRTALRPGPPSHGAAVAASLARSLLPSEADSPPPRWLLPSQQRSFRRVLAALERHRGAILADPVGSGKTYIALAVAASFNRGNPTACLVPATLQPQWDAAAKKLEIPLLLCSHEQVSRGKLPDDTRGLVVVDESHRFRNPHTRRYTHLASWLVGRPALLVTATPIVNRLSDLGHQLLLSVRDDTLVMDGLVSLRLALARGCAAPALGRLVIETRDDADMRPRKVTRISNPAVDESDRLAGSVELLDRLHLSSSESIATLIRGVLLRAAGSSPAALVGALQRYRRLLLHARDALQAGHSLERAALRRFTAELGDQLVWWELLPCNEEASDLELADIPVLESIIPVATAAVDQWDSKLERLRDLLCEERATLVFTASRDTVRYIRERLSDLRLAWCTGNRAGLASTPLPRRVVLGWFSESLQVGAGPRHLVVTDVAAEGLDLQRAARVVHYDLPWTPMRLEQREGRAVRLGSRHSEVEVVRFAPVPILERSLHLEAILARKAKLPATAGLGIEGRHIWRWRTELAERYGESEATAGVAQVLSPHRGLLAGFAFYRSSSPQERLCSTVGWLELGGGWTEAPEVVSDRLGRAAAQTERRIIDGERLPQYLTLLAPLIQKRLSLTSGRRWLSPDPTPATRQVAGRLRKLIGQAARLRQHDSLRELEQGLGFVAGGHTAGEEMLLERLAGAPTQELISRLSQAAPTVPGWPGIEVRLTGLIVFSPDPVA